MTRVRWIAHSSWTLAMAVALFGCGGKEPPKVSLDKGGALPVDATAGAMPGGRPSVDPDAGLGPSARAALDAGNAAFRAKNYSLALRHYRAAAASAPAQAAPWFGIYMIAQATGNKPLADSANAEVQRRTADPAAVTDSTLRNTHPAPKAKARTSA